LRYCTALAMVAPTMQARVRFNRLKGVRIGRDPWLGVLAYLDIHHSHPEASDSLVLGDHVAIGNNVSIYTHDSAYHRITGGREPVRFGRVVIGDHCHIAPHAFLYDVTIGAHSVVAPATVLAGGEYPPYSLIAGSPPRVLKSLRDVVDGSRAGDTTA
jgi:acetyltransferase-like isoleucine patch superfamily enzyme